MNDIKIIKTKDNKECILINIDNKYKPLGSKYNFSNDENKLINNIINNPQININTTIFIIGLYNGEYLDNISKKLSPKNKIIILEFNKEIFDKYKNKIVNNCEIYLADDSFDANFIKIRTKNFKIFCFGLYENVFKNECIKLYSHLKDMAINIKLNENTFYAFGDTWFKCMIKNLPIILKSDVLLNYKNYYKGFIAIIVSAGPSLEKNIKKLKKIQNKCVIIANGRTLKSLIKYGIQPTLVCVIDPGEGSYSVIKESLNCSVPMVVNEASNYKVVNEYRGNKIFYDSLIHTGFLNYILPENKETFLTAGGSVAHASVDLAKYLGCKNIVFIGQDLAYTNNKEHSDIANISAENITNKFDLMVEDINGKKIGTSYVLNEFRLYLERYISNNSEIEFINATEGGANIKGTKIETLDNFIKNKTFKNNIPIIETNNNYKNINKNKIKIKLENLINELNIIKKLSNEILDINEKFINYNNRKNIGEFIKKIELKEKKLKKLINSLMAIQIVLQPVMNKVTNSNKYIAKLNSNYEEKIKLSYKQTKELYSQITIKINFCIKLVQELIDFNFN